MEGKDLPQMDTDEHRCKGAHPRSSTKSSHGMSVIAAKPANHVTLAWMPVITGMTKFVVARVSRQFWLETRINAGGF
jgi:hypothetical protein